MKNGIGRDCEGWTEFGYMKQENESKLSKRKLEQGQWEWL
jgi:hypothetical protein